MSECPGQAEAWNVSTALRAVWLLIEPQTVKSWGNSDSGLGQGEAVGTALEGRAGLLWRCPGAGPGSPAFSVPSSDKAGRAGHCGQPEQSAHPHSIPSLLLATGW